METNAFVIQRLRDFHLWRDRTVREKQLLLFAAATLTLGLMYLALIEPALNGRDYWQQILPQLRSERAQIKALAKQLAETPAASLVTDPWPDRVVLERSLADAGIQPASLALSDQQIQINWSDVSFSALVSWLHRTQRAHALVVAEASIRAKEGIDRVDATIVYRRPRSSP